MNRRRGYQARKSDTRSATLSGRQSLRKGQRNMPRSAQVVGLQRPPRPDPTLLSWPQDVVIIVAACPATVLVRQILGRITDQYCRDCGRRLAVDSYSIELLWHSPLRQGRPIAFLGVDCCFGKYSTHGVQLSRAGPSRDSGDTDSTDHGSV